MCRNRPARVVALLALLMLVATVPAAGQDGYHLGAVSMVTGGTSDTSLSGYSLTTSIGQPDAQETHSGEYSFVGGILPEGGYDSGNDAFTLFIPVVTK